MRLKLPLSWIPGLIALAVALLMIAASAYQEFRLLFPSSPAMWARQRADTFRDGSRYLRLARGFERRGDVWAEATLSGPFTDMLAEGQMIVTAEAAEAWPADLEGRRLGDAKPYTVPEGMVGAIVQDPAIDSDACYDSRRILVRFRDGSHRGELLSIERIYLRRWPAPKVSRQKQ